MLFVAGCTSHGRAAVSTAPRHSATSSTAASRSLGTARASTPSQGTANPASSGATSSARPVPSGSIARRRAATAIGDPVTADLCGSIGLDPLRHIGTALTPTFDKRQDPPGCAITLAADGKAALGLSVFADAGKPKAAAGRTQRTQSGQTVYVYRFDSATGSCEREVAAFRVRLVVDSYRPPGAPSDRSTACAGTDALTARLAEAASARDVPRLQLASPSVSDLNACAVVRTAGITSLTLFANGRLGTLSFGVGCRVRPPNVFLFLNFVIDADRRPAGSTLTTAGAHSAYALATTGGFCSYFAPQGRTSDGQYEQVAASTTWTGTGAAPANLCDQTKTALGRYLDAAGLR
jgi:hypothetical protein